MAEPAEDLIEEMRHKARTLADDLAYSQANNREQARQWDATKREVAQAKAENAGLRKLLQAAAHALKSYAHGNAAPDLALSVAAAIDAALAPGALQQETRHVS